MTDPRHSNPAHQPGGWPPQQHGARQPYGAPQQQQQFGAPPQQPPYGAPPQQPHGALQQPYGVAPQQQPQFGAPHGYGQQPPMPPQYGGQFPQPPPQRGNNAVPLILGGVAVVAILGIGAWFLLSGTGGGGLVPGSSNPKDVAADFVNGGGNNKDLICKSDLAKLSSVSAPAVTPTNMPKISTKQTLGKVNVPSGSDEGTFTVDVQATISGKTTTQTLTYDLVKESGEWKVCGLANAIR
ncbi:hypothetical protein HLB23_00740 [Nocardia uniformis]|uniref:DUF4878 domain-containing protein n=1 Tax=Nocardia uniformis TaxID=53432 RepID=A0A849BQS3_9NOCA|nr:hypothetical protein [Nocardia uniformis]NNH68424.1 hypothetical protein [Nocardia uniformis]